MSDQKLNGTVQKAPNQSLGFNVDSPISRAVAKRFFNQGYQFCLRYVSLEDGEAPGDLTYGEASNILDGGLALMPVQHARYAGWHPNSELGQQYGGNAAANADRIGFPPGVNLWCDLQEISSDATAQEVIDYCQAWYKQVNSYGYIPGLYVGAGSILNQEQLYKDLSFQHYWKSASDVPNVGTRGYQMIQHSAGNGNNLSINHDITYIDNEGGQPQWLINPRFA